MTLALNAPEAQHPVAADELTLASPSYLRFYRSCPKIAVTDAYTIHRIDFPCPGPIKEEAQFSLSGYRTDSMRVDDKLADLVADDHEIVRRGWFPDKKTQPTWKCARAENGRQAVELAKELEPGMSSWTSACLPSMVWRRAPDSGENRRRDC